MGGIIIYFRGLARLRIAVTVHCRAVGCKVSLGGYKVSHLCPGPHCHYRGCKVRRGYKVRGGKVQFIYVYNQPARAPESINCLWASFKGPPITPPPPPPTHHLKTGNS